MTVCVASSIPNKNTIIKESELLPRYRHFRNSFALLLIAVSVVAALPAQAQKLTKDEKKLTKRVDQFYRLFVSGEWDKVEPFVTPDTRSIWIEAPKSKLISYRVVTVKIEPDGKRATATVAVVSTVPRMPGAPLNHTQSSDWMNENGQWYIKLKRQPSLLEIFHSIKAPSDVARTQPPLLFEQNPIKIPPSDGTDEKVIKVPYQSIAGYAINIQGMSTSCACLTAEVDRTTMNLGEKGVLTLHYRPAANVPTQTNISIHATVAPLMYPLNLTVIVAQ
jgi:hypothetical protein